MEGYDDAVAALYSPLHQARTPEALKQTSLRRTKTIEDMREYLRRMTLSREELPNNIVHITGTKGKGSTACMCEAILQEGYNLNTGLYTSPHLVDIRERIRVNGKPVSKQVFAQAYWTVRRRLEQYKGSEEDLPVLPGYFRMLTLMALYVFSNYEPTIDVVILEVGMGGRYDATNILDNEDRNVVCGVTLLDLDHTRVLGDIIPQIAWEKGGIFQVKKGSTAHVSERPLADDTVDVTTSETDSAKGNPNKRLFALDTNTEAALSILRKCAAVEGQGQQLHLVSEGQSLPPNTTLGLQGDHQRINAELAVALCNALTENMSIPGRDSEAEMHTALQNAHWPGRCQSVELHTKDGTLLNLRLDGAHTPKALAACIKWYSSVSSGGESNQVYRVLIFNCSHERNPVELLQQLAYCRPSFDAVFFCRADFERPSIVGKATARDLLEPHGITIAQEEKQEARTWQDTLAEVWKHLEIDSPASATTDMNVGDAVRQLQSLTGYERIEALVTGSLYIVGSVLDAVEWREDPALGSIVER